MVPEAPIEVKPVPSSGSSELRVPEWPREGPQASGLVHPRDAKTLLEERT